jgi:peptide/nickel transport system substrate-binding protein
MKTTMLLALVAALAFAAPATQAQSKKDTLVLGMVLEPPGLDPTTGAAAAIGEITHYNLYECLTRINEKGEVEPGLAKSWTISEDQKVYTFKLIDGVKFHNGEPFSSATVKFAFERAKGEKSTNKRKAVFANMEAIETPDPSTVVLKLKTPNPNLLFNLGENTAALVEPKSADSNATNPVGTGPFKFSAWQKGQSVTLVKAETYRDPASIKLSRITFRFINDPSAMTAALLSGDLDAVPQGGTDNIDQFKRDKRFVVTEGLTQGETVLGINNKRKPFDDVRVRRAISHAINRQEIIDGAMNGVGVPIGSHFSPHHPDYVDLTGVYPHDVNKAKALLAEAGVAPGTQWTLTLPPPAYARRGGEIIAAQLAKVGIQIKIDNVEWAQWLDGVYKNKNFDLTIVSHVEPLDMVIYEDTKYYFQYDNEEFRTLMQQSRAALDPKERSRLTKLAQTKLAEDAVNGFLFMLPRVSYYKKGLVGIWENAPIFVNDLTKVHWQ